MRTALAALLTAAALAAAAQPALADDPYASFYRSSDTTQTTSWCVTSWQYGIPGAFGAWGKFIDGCTASAWCPWNRCSVRQATAKLENSAASRTTCNMTVRIFNVYGALRYRADYSSGGATGCWQARTAPDANYGEVVTVQSNGVIASASGRVTSYIWLAAA